MPKSSTVQDYKLIDIFLFVSLAIALSYFLWWSFRVFTRQDQKRDTQRKEEFRENLKTGAVDEPHILRQLSAEEERILLRDRKGLYRFIQFHFIILPIFLAVLSFSIYWGFKNNLFIERSFIDAFIVIFCIFMFYLYLIYLESAMYKDLRSPVFKVRGELLKQVKGHDKAGNVTRCSFIIRGVEFDSGENPQVAGHWDEWNEEDVVLVEYSPFTKHIWKIEKV